MFEAMLTTADRPILTASAFREDVWGARQVVRTGPPPAEELEVVIPDSAIALTVAEMASRLRAVAKPTQQEDVPLSVDPDDYPLF